MLLAQVPILFAALYVAPDLDLLDLLILGGRIVDGTGNPGFAADVGITGDRISALGRLAGRRAKTVVDARGLVVAPGFVDMHNHSDDTLLEDGNAESMIRQGVTSIILGESTSAAPSPRFARFRDYFAALAKSGTSVNVGSYVGSGTIFAKVHGAHPGEPSAAELDEMRSLVRAAMDDGALGVASALSGPPSSWMSTDTLVAMCEAAAPLGGIYSTHIRTEGFGIFDAIAEAIEIGRRAHVPVDIIHLKIADHHLWGQTGKLLAQIAAARASGADVQANVYPYTAGQNDLASIIPPWAHEGGRAAMIARLRDPALRPKLEKDVLGGIPGWYNHYTATGSWNGMLLVSLQRPEDKPFEGKRMSALIAARGKGKKPTDVLFDLLVDNDGSVPTVYFHHSEADMRKVLATSFVSIGSDGTAVTATGPLAAGHPHPRYFGTFPRVLGRYVRQEKILTLEDAVRKMTSSNAAKAHAYDRGLLRVGLAADVTLFDPEKVIDNATFEKPHQYPTGIEVVIVGGKIVIDHGRHTGARPGVILYGPGKK